MRALVRPDRQLLARGRSDEHLRSQGRRRRTDRGRVGAAHPSRPGPRRSGPSSAPGHGDARRAAPPYRTISDRELTLVQICCDFVCACIALPLSLVLLSASPRCRRTRSGQLDDEHEDRLAVSVAVVLALALGGVYRVTHRRLQPSAFLEIRELSFGVGLRLRARPGHRLLPACRLRHDRALRHPARHGGHRHHRRRSPWAHGPSLLPARADDDPGARRRDGHDRPTASCSSVRQDPAMTLVGRAVDGTASTPAPSAGWRTSRELCQQLDVHRILVAAKRRVLGRVARHVPPAAGLRAHRDGAALLRADQLALSADRPLRHALPRDRPTTPERVGQVHEAGLRPVHQLGGLGGDVALLLARGDRL